MSAAGLPGYEGAAYSLGAKALRVRVCAIACVSCDIVSRQGCAGFLGLQTWPILLGCGFCVVCLSRGADVMSQRPGACLCMRLP